MSFLRQVVITRAHNIHKKMIFFLDKYFAFVELSDKNMDKKNSPDKNQEPDGQKKRRKKTKGIANTKKKDFLDNFFARTIFLSRQKGIYHQVEFCQATKYKLCAT